MRNLTIVVDEETLRRARIRALDQGTSVNRVLSEFLEAYAGAPSSMSAVERALAIAQREDSGSGEGGRRWRRDDLYET